jgi:hypothetical protein
LAVEVHYHDGVGFAHPAHPRFTRVKPEQQQGEALILLERGGQCGTAVGRGSALGGGRFGDVAQAVADHADDVVPGYAAQHAGNGKGNKKVS